MVIGNGKCYLIGVIIIHKLLIDADGRAVLLIRSQMVDVNDPPASQRAIRLINKNQ